MTPYQYAANNPLLFVDINGDSIDISNLLEDQLDAFKSAVYEKTGYNVNIVGNLAVLGEIDKNFSGSSSSAFFSVFNELAGNSGSNILVSVNSGLSESALFQPAGPSINSGGTLEFSDTNFGNFSHELFHGYQNMMVGGGNNFEKEIQSFLFSDVVDMQINSLSPSTYFGGSISYYTNYNNVLNSLYSSNSINISTYSHIVNNFGKTELGRRYINRLGNGFRAPNKLNPSILGIIR